MFFPSDFQGSGLGDGSQTRRTFGYRRAVLSNGTSASDFCYGGGLFGASFGGSRFGLRRGAFGFGSYRRARFGGFGYSSDFFGFVAFVFNAALDGSDDNLLDGAFASDFFVDCLVVGCLFPSDFFGGRFRCSFLRRRCSFFCGAGSATGADNFTTCGGFALRRRFSGWRGGLTRFAFSSNGRFFGSRFLRRLRRFFGSTFGGFFARTGGGGFFCRFCRFPSRSGSGRFFLISFFGFFGLRFFALFFVRRSTRCGARRTFGEAGVSLVLSDFWGRRRRRFFCWRRCRRYYFFTHRRFRFRFRRFCERRLRRRCCSRTRRRFFRFLTLTLGWLCRRFGGGSGTTYFTTTGFGSGNG